MGKIRDGSDFRGEQAIDRFLLIRSPLPAHSRLSGSPGDGRVGLSWEPPASDGGAVIIDYLVQISGDAGKTWATVADGVSSATSATVTGLTNGASSIFRVAAVNAVGTGAPSDSSAAFVPATFGGFSEFSAPQQMVTGTAVPISGRVFDPTGTAVDAIHVYRDLNGNGVLDLTIDQLLHADPTPGDGFAWDTSTLASGVHQLFTAAIKDGSVVASTPLTVTAAQWWDLSISPRQPGEARIQSWTGELSTGLPQGVGKPVYVAPGTNIADAWIATVNEHVKGTIVSTNPNGSAGYEYRFGTEAFRVGSRGDLWKQVKNDPKAKGTFDIDLPDSTQLIVLEDLTASPNNDFDYDDQYWVVTWSPLLVDLDVDSDNTGTLERTAHEDDIEEGTDDQGVIVRPGVIVPVGPERVPMIVDVPQGRTATLAFAQGVDMVRVYDEQTSQPGQEGEPVLKKGTQTTTVVGGSPRTFWIEAFAPSATMADITFTLTLDVSTGSGSTGSPPSDTIRATATWAETVDLDVDTNRDQAIDDADEKDEDKWESGAGKSGAVILPNLDKDGTGPAPDNWSGLEDWDGDGAIDPANTKIDGNGDIDDIGPLWAKMFDLPALPDRLTISLQVATIVGENEYFSTVAANRRIRIFLPTQVDGANMKVKAGDEEIIGPSTSDTVTFVKTPSGAGQHAFDIFKGTGTVRFGIEGIEQGAMVDITLTVTIGDKEVGRDVVRVRIAPFVLNDHRNNVAAGTAAAPTVFVTNMGGFNTELRETALPKAFADSVGVAAIGDPWQQDGYEIGYAQAPYAQMPIVLELPRSRTGGGLSRYVRTTLLRKDVGVNIRIPGFAGNTQDSGGNFESIPKAGGGPGYFFHGKSMTGPHVDFFNAQRVNDERPVNTDWLLVGHVDEVVSLAQSGDRVMVADPDSAWALLVWANKLDPTARMLQDMNDDPDGDGGDPAIDGVTVADVLGDAALRAWNFSTVMAAENLPAIREDVAMAMGVSPPETTPLAAPANTGMAQLDKGGGLVGLFPNANVRNYEIKFTNATNYEFRYKEAGGDWSAPAVGRRDRDEVFADSRAFILKHYWSGGAPAAGDVFTFAADPGAKMIEVPVLFQPVEDPDDGILKSLAYTTNFINSLVSGTTVVTGRGYGPKVIWSGPGPSDIFEGYTTGTFKLAGMDEGKIIRADGREYHDAQGFIHCGTNVIRDIPNDKWWNR